MKRRKYIVTNTKAIADMTIIPGLSSLSESLSQQLFISYRPPLVQRTFTSDGVEVKGVIKEIELGWMFENCYPNTLDITVDYEIIGVKYCPLYLTN